jgi:hypothetical protein
MEGGQKDFVKINQYIKEFLDFNGYNSTLECFEAEEKTKKVTKQTGANINKVPNNVSSLNER